MSTTDFLSQWTGSPLVVAPPNALHRATLSPKCKEFLATVGLPSNALWFDRSSTAIMSFDGVAHLRTLSEADVPMAVWNAVASMRPLTVLGVYDGSFVVVDNQGEMHMISCQADDRLAVNPDWSATLFVNVSVSCFAASLIAYKKVRDVIEHEKYDFDAPAIRAAVAEFRRSIAAADPQALADADTYWSQILDGLDVW